MAPSFLDLPYHVRERIYSLAGLFRDCPINLSQKQMPAESSNFRLGPTCYFSNRQAGRMTPFRGTNYRDCRCPELPLRNLSLVSRRISDEVTELFYSRNKFVLRAHAAADLATLVRVGPKAWRAMTSFLLRLNCWPCPNGHDTVGQFMPPGLTECFMCRAKQDTSDPSLNFATAAGRDMILFWREVCNYLTVCIAPHRLRLTLVCDVSDVATAREVLGPLSTIPPLNQCTIRLGRRSLAYNSELAILARTTAENLSGDFVHPPAVAHDRPRSAPVPSFMTLPREIRLRILEHTDLISRPLPRVTYNIRGRRQTLPRNDRRKPPPLVVLSGTRQVLGSDYALFSTSASQFRFKRACCEKCTETSADCCCPTAHESYAANCVCRLLPLALFSVCKPLRQEALRVFWTNSYFSFLGESFAVNKNYLEKRLPRDGLILVPRLNFVFEQRHFSAWEVDGHHAEWSDLVDFIKSSMDLSRLRLEIQTSCIWERCYDSVNWGDENSFLQEENRHVYNVHLSIANDLCRLKGLKEIYFQLGWFKGLAPWLAREVLGDRYTRFYPEIQPGDGERSRAVRARPRDHIPLWHDLNQRLPNSNYVESTSAEKQA